MVQFSSSWKLFNYFMLVRNTLERHKKIYIEINNRIPLLKISTGFQIKI